jgi:hypothetical protein
MGFGGFSWKRALGISAAKARLSRRIGIPLTKSGRQRKLGRLVSGGGCLVVLAGVVAIPVGLAALLIVLWSTHLDRKRHIISAQPRHHAQMSLAPDTRLGASTVGKMSSRNG